MSRNAKKSGGLSVWKFGGASLADHRAVRDAAARIASHDGPLVVVASALAGITDLLIDGADGAVAGDAARAERAASIFGDRHRLIVTATVPAGPARQNLIAAVDSAMAEYRDLCTAIRLIGHLTPRVSDVIVSRGERLSAALLAAAIGSAGRRSEMVDAAVFVHTDDHHGAAAPMIPETTRKARKVLRPLIARGIVAAVPGFTGRAPDGSTTTLGRGGSDLTATLLGRALGARQVVLWKDVPGILTADPRLVPDARLIPELHQREAAEVAHYGAKVLHPRALIPIAGSRTTLVVRSFVEPDRPGTEISGRHVMRGYPVKAVAVLPTQAVVTVAGKGMVGVHGIAARTFGAVDAERLSVSTIFQGSSESSIGFTVPEAEADRAVRRLRQAFRHELETGLIDSVTARTGQSVVAVVGEGMAGTPGIAARVFTSLEAGNINVVAIAQGSSERNISLVVPAADAPEAVRRVHAAFQLAKIGGGRANLVRHTDVVLLGFGRVGRALADQIAARANGPRVRIVGLLDRSGYVFDPKGISRSRLLRLAHAKDGGALLSTLGGHKASALEALGVMAGHAVSHPIVVDVTSEETGDLLQTALGQGFDVVLANKKPLAGSIESYAQLFESAEAAGRRVRFEATVGAGLPIIDTYRKLADTGDRVLRVDGCVSGTLMYVLSEISSGRPFSEAVVEAVARGYAEPDPREDLSGQDAARKGLILGRLIGYRGPAPSPDDLVPPALRRLPLTEFLAQLPSLDAGWKARVAAEAAKGCVLRYVVSATPRRVTARLVAVPAASPMGAAAGTRNIITFTSSRYRAEPLVISGPGAGAEVTAAGILNDVSALALR